MIRMANPSGGLHSVECPALIFAPPKAEVAQKSKHLHLLWQCHPGGYLQHLAVTMETTEYSLMASLRLPNSKDYIVRVTTSCVSVV